MVKSLFLSIFALCFLALGSSTHVKFMDCGKCAFNILSLVYSFSYKFLSQGRAMQGHLRYHAKFLCRVICFSLTDSHRFELALLF